MNALRRSCAARPKTALLLLALVYLAANAIYPMLNKPLATTHYLGTALDDWLTFSPVWAVPYVIWYLYLPGVGILLMYRDRKACATALLAMLLGLICSYITFALFQTTVPRPDVPGADLFSELVRQIYKADQPYNAFPSIHVLASSILMLTAAKSPGLGKKAKAVIYIVGVLIIFSTLFIKQHVAADVLGGMVFAWAAYTIVSRYLLPVIFGEEDQKCLQPFSQLDTAPKYR